jgi:tetratricopeptide (TPR) repeat protein
MRRKLALPPILLTLTFCSAISAHAFQGAGAGRIQGGFGFTGPPGGGFTGPRGTGFTDTLPDNHGVNDVSGPNLMQGLRLRRAGNALLRGKLNENANRSRSATNLNSGNATNNVNSININNNKNVNRIGVGWNNPYIGHHGRWAHGYWNGQYPGGLGWRGQGNGDPGSRGASPGGGVGIGTGWGLSPWLFGPMLYHYGYSHFFNPYAGAIQGVALRPVAHDYSQPLEAQGTPPPKAATDQAAMGFDIAREAFRRGDYSSALDLADHALRSTPADPILHEFRALVLFALNRYDEAAPALYAVLSVEPGWDWATLIGLYGDPARYTQQLRALQSFSSHNPRSAQAHFVLAYHFLSQGSAEAALRRFKLVTALQPEDTLSAQLIQQLERPWQGIVPAGLSQRERSTAAAAAAQTVAGTAATAKRQKLVGTWRTQPSHDMNIEVAFQDSGRFTWKVNRQDKGQQFQGKSVDKDGLLTLVQDQNENTMVTSLHWTDAAHFVLKVLDAWPGDPGLSFTKSPEG